MPRKSKRSIAIELCRADVAKYDSLIRHYKRNHGIGLKQPEGKKPDTRLDIIKELRSDAQYKLNNLLQEELEAATGSTRKRTKKSTKSRTSKKVVRIKKPK